MKPLELTLAGFKGIQAGMQLKTFHIDLRAFDAAQLVAIVAPNGRGKTTVLDNLQPYRLMPSKIKNGNYSPEAFSFFDHLVGPGDACKELIWEHGGVTYRTLLEWKLREKTQSTAAYLQRRTNDDDLPVDEWEPVTLPDGTSSDGKAKTYDRCVEGILGSPRLYFTAAFSAQGRSQLSSYAQGDIKGLMAEVLDLRRIQDLGEKSGEVGKGLRTALVDRRERLSALDEVREQASNLRTAIADHARALTTTHVPAIEHHRQAAAQERLAIADMLRQQQDAEELRTRRAAVQQQIDAAATEYKQTVATIQKDITTGASTYDQILQKFDSDQRKLDDALGKAGTRKASALQLLSQRDAINEAAIALPALRENLTKAEAAVEAAQTAVNDARQSKNSLDALDKHIKTLVEAGQKARAVEQGLLTTCALTKEVPCQGTDLQGRCKLLTDALAAEGKLPAARDDIAAKTAEYHEANTRKTELAAKAATLPALEAELTKAQTAKRAAAQLVTDKEALSAKAEGLVSAEAALDDAEDTIRAGNDQLQELQEERQAAQQIAAERAAELQARLETAASANQATMQRLQTELDRIPEPGDDSALRLAEQRLAFAELGEQQARDAADRCRGAIAQGEGRLSALEESLAAGDTLAREVAYLDAEVAHWSLLGKALGRDGILALSIDDAGPTLAGLTNDLLLSCYGPRFSVRIDTQEVVKSTNAMKETFDVIVFDSESDTSKSVSEMSGGERIWINEALTRALALYQAQQSGRTFQTLFSDESDGALDPEKKGQFVKMKREVLKLGGYDCEYFISHSPDVWPLADAVINLGELIEAH